MAIFLRENTEKAVTHHPKSLIGLDGVAAAETRLSAIDGERGVLVIAGERVERLAVGAGFEAVAARLWSLADGVERDPEHVRAALAAARLVAFDMLPSLLAATAGMPVVPAFRAAIAGLGPRGGLEPEAVIVGAMPVIAAAIVRAARGRAPVRPDPTFRTPPIRCACFAARCLRMPEARALDTYLVTVSDHGMNASTFASRVVASTGADLFMAVTAGYCALTGPLHGGAPEPVLEMLDAIGSRDRIAPWIDAALARGERLMGFGHRVYRVRDPRADVLKAAVAVSLGRSEAELGLAAEVEAYARQALARAKPDRALDTNVEFYTAILLDALGIPRQAFTPVFAAARAAGWTAHAMEQQRNGRLLGRRRLMSERCLPIEDCDPGGLRKIRGRLRRSGAVQPANLRMRRLLAMEAPHSALWFPRRFPDNLQGLTPRTADRAFRSHGAHRDEVRRNVRRRS